MVSFILGILIGLMEIVTYYEVSLKASLVLGGFFVVCGIIAYAIKKIGL